MSNSTPNCIRVAGFVKNTTRLTAPDLDNPANNTAFSNQMVTRWAVIDQFA